MRLRRIEPILRRALSGPCRVPPGSAVLVAVSGGADSTALLVGLRRLAPEFGYRLGAAHLHHGLRDAEADGDLEFVRGLCHRLGVPLASARWDARARMRRRGLTGQEGLRRLRREFLRRAAHRAGASAIATGHTADDQLETLLMRLLRGAGLRGLGGMSARRGIWMRPMLAASRDMIVADLGEAGLSWREDRSNADPRYTRSRIRHQAIPALLRALGPPGSRALGARGALARRVARGLVELRSARRVVERQAMALLGARETRGPSGGRAPGPGAARSVVLDCRRLRPYPLAVKRAALRLAWNRLGRRSGLTDRHLEALRGIIGSSRVGASVYLPGGMGAWRLRQFLRIEPRTNAAQQSQARSSQRLRVPGRGSLGGYRVRGTWIPGAEARHRVADKPPGDEYFAADAISGGLELRTAGSDEWFVPFGRRRPRQLGEFLRKQGVPAAVRARQVVLADAGGILWVLGARRSARALLTTETRKALWIHTESHD